MIADFVAPLDGRLVGLDKVPDPVFSQKILGDGFAIEPVNGEVVSPVNGTVTTVMDSKHAIGLTSHTGLEIIVHFGIDTVNLCGEGFRVFVKAGDKVKAGQLLLVADMDQVIGRVPSVITPIVFTNLTGQTVTIQEGLTVKRGEPMPIALSRQE